MKKFISYEQPKEYADLIQEILNNECEDTDLVYETLVLLRDKLLQVV